MEGLKICPYIITDTDFMQSLMHFLESLTRKSWILSHFQGICHSHNYSSQLWYTA